MNVHSGNPCGGTSFPHPPDFTGFPIASHNPFGKFPPGGPLRPDPLSSAVGPQESKCPRCSTLPRPPAASCLSSGLVSTLHVAPSEPGGARRRANRREETPAAPARRRRRGRGPRFERTETPATAPDGPGPPLPESRDETRAPEPDDDGDKGASGPQAGSPHPRVVARSQRSRRRRSRCFLLQTRVPTGPSWRLKRPFGSRDAA